MNEEKQKSDLMAVCFFGVLLAYLTYTFVLSEFWGERSDHIAHTYSFVSLYLGGDWMAGWRVAPYGMWHLTVIVIHCLLRVPVENAAAFATCIYMLFSYFIVYWILQRVTDAFSRRDSSLRSAFLAFCVCIIQGVYLFWLDVGERFQGMYSMNPISNPTYMCAKGFALLCFCLVCDIWGRQKDENYHGIFFRVENGLKRYYIYLAILLFLSVLAKPTFAEMFIPAVAFLMLWELIRRIAKKDGGAMPYFRHCLITLACAVPALLYILLQFLIYFTWGGSYLGDGSLVVTEWFEVWRMYSQNVGVSIALGMVFPLFMLLVNGAYFVKSDMGKLALAGYLISLLEAALLGESGLKLAHGNFLWPMMSGMLLMYLVSTMRLLALERQQADTKVRRVLIAAGWFLFFVQTVYGMEYLFEWAIG